MAHAQPLEKALPLPDSDQTHDFLSRFVASDIASRKRRAICLPYDMSVEKVLAVFQKENIISAPVLREKPNGDSPFEGIINMWDIVTATCFQSLFDTYDDSKFDEEDLANEYLDEALRMEILRSPVGNLLGLSAESKTLWVREWDTPLSSLVELFSKGVHSILVRGEGGREKVTDDYRVVSQTDVVRFLGDMYSYEITHLLPQGQVPIIKSFMSREIGHLGLVQPVPKGKNNEIVTITTKNSALTGFRKMTLHDCRSVAVLDEHGKLVGTLTTSDLRGMTQATFKNVLLPVMKFLAVVQAKPHIHEPRTPVTCTAQTTLRDVVEKVRKTGVHRLWVVNNEGHPIGVVSLSDIILVFSPYNYNAAAMKD